MRGTSSCGGPGVLVLLLLVDAAFSPAMFVLVPLLAAGCLAVAHSVTATATATDA